MLGRAGRDRRLGPELDDERARARRPRRPRRARARRAASAPASRSARGRGDVHAASSPTRRAASASRSSASRPPRTAATIAAWTPSTCSGVRSGAEAERVGAGGERPHRRLPDPPGPPAPCISSASVITTPSKPSSSRSSSTTAGSASPARRRGAEADVRGHDRARPGLDGRAERRQLALEQRRARASAVGSARCESASVSPWPGKCFAHAATPALCRPSTNAATCRATSCGSEPNERTPTIGLAGSTQHVGDRREVEVDPDRGQLAADRRARRAASARRRRPRRARRSRGTSCRSRPRAG